MPTLEPFHDEEYGVEDEDFWPEQPQRISVSPLVIWGVVGLVALSVTVAAVATLLLPEQLNPILRSQSQQTTDELAQFDEEVDAEETTRSQPSPADGLLPEPPPQSSNSELSTSDAATPDAGPSDVDSISSTSAIVSDAAIVSLEAPAPVNNGLPVQTIVLLTTGCALLSGGVTLALRSWLRRDVTLTLPQPKMPSLQWQQSRNTRQRSRSDTPAPPPAAPQPQPSVMVLPPEAVTPLDQFSDEESGDLAAQLDIRRRYSLSSLIEEDLD